MHHTRLQGTPIHMLFGPNMILNTPLISYWEAIGRCKQELIDENYQNEN